MNIPTKHQCYRFFDEMRMLQHIVAHSELVCRVALCLTRHMRAYNIKLNDDLVYASAMLHDITKTRSFKTKENHAETGGDYLTERGYPEVGHIVAQHVKLDDYFASPEPNEAEIVNYADKRVLHDEIAPLDRRMGYILEKYGNNPDHRDQIMQMWEKSVDLETRLFAYLPFSPDQLETVVKRGVVHNYQLTIDN
jgi:putative nucleotidyltransferase with HDIG domain